jgi:hypothetical protein
LPSGLLGKLCHFCTPRWGVDVFVLLVRPDDILILISISEIFGCPNETARGEQTYAVGMKRSMHFDNECLDII